MPNKETNRDIPYPNVADITCTNHLSITYPWQQGSSHEYPGSKGHIEGLRILNEALIWPAITVQDLPVIS